MLFTLSACNQVRPSNQNIRASQTTNEVAAANLDLGIEYMKQGAYENALKNLEKAKEADPDYAPIYNVTRLTVSTTWR